jgi:hypothetical protein
MSPVCVFGSADTAALRRAESKRSAVFGKRWKSTASKARDAARLLRKGAGASDGEELEYMARDEATGGQVMVFKIEAQDVAITAVACEDH